MLVVSAQAVAFHSNNYEIFRTSFLNLVGGQDLYALNDRHRDYFWYSPTFALLFAPFALLPFWLGVLLWTALNGFALYWGLGRVLGGEALMAARALVYIDAIGAMQNVQSNALITGLVLIGCGALDRRREWRAALAIALATAIKIFPVLAAAYAIFRPYRAPRFAGFAVLIGVLLLAAPLMVLTPDELLAQYRSWAALQQNETVMRGHSVMYQLELLFGWQGPNLPIQLAGLAVLLAPLGRLQYWGLERYRLLFIASLLMYFVLFNHTAESPSYLFGVTGVALWFTQVPRSRFTWAVLVIVILGTVLSSSEAMPKFIQLAVFEPYRLKVWPVLLVWVLTQLELWRQTAPGGSRAAPPAPAPTAP